MFALIVVPFGKRLPPPPDTPASKMAWVDRFNHRRLLEPIGNIPSAEAEEKYYQQLTEPAQAA